jgi:glutaredoxin-like protein NrdH
MEHVEGKNNKHKVFIYALSTCIWCRKTKQLLKDMQVDYSFEDVDNLTGDAEKKAIDDIVKRTGKELYPTVIIDDKIAISGYKEEEVKKALAK